MASGWNSSAGFKEEWTVQASQRPEQHKVDGGLCPAGKATSNMETREDGSTLTTLQEVQKYYSASRSTAGV